MALENEEIGSGDADGNNFDNNIDPAGVNDTDY